jgi:hypothetical protein
MHNLKPFNSIGLSTPRIRLFTQTTSPYSRKHTLLPVALALHLLP